MILRRADAAGRRCRIACAATVLAVAVLTLLGAGPARADEPAVDRTPTDPDLTEDSGIAFSLQHRGVLWSINDSGNPPVLYALGRDGATVGTVRVSGVPNVDWEAVAAFRGPRGEPLLAVADIGDNAGARDGVEIDVLAEPAALGRTTQAPKARLRLTYPDGAHDAETLLVDAKRQRMFVVTKGLGSTVYAVPPAVWPGGQGAKAQRSGTLQPVGSVSLLLATDGAVLPDGHAVVRTYTSLALLSPPADGDVRVLATVDLPPQKQGEGLAVDAAGTSVLLSSEGRRQPILTLALPESFENALSRNGSGAGAATAGATPPASSPAGAAAAAGTAGTGGTGGAAGTTGDAVPAAEPLQDARPGESPPVWNLLAGVAVLVGVTVALRAWVRRR